jgi:hypothetical protein
MRFFWLQNICNIALFYLTFVTYFCNSGDKIVAKDGAVKKVRNSSRKWLVTINHPEEHGFTHDVIKDILSRIENLDYWVMCDEIGGKTACYHTHLFFYRKNGALRFDYIKKLFPTAHFDYPLGTAQENRDYIRKEGKYLNSEKSTTNLTDTFEEFGECPVEAQGKRNDLNNLYEMIKDGSSNFEILEENPGYMNRLDTIDKVRELLRYEEFRNKRRLDLHVEYWYGEPGTGKTRGVLDRYGDSNVYTVTDYKHPWDDYHGEDVILFDDFDATKIDLNTLLKWLDVYPLRLPCRYSNKQACYTKVFFTSNQPLDMLYGYIQREEPVTWQAFLRRFHCVKEFGKSGLKEYQNIDDYINKWRQSNVSASSEQFYTPSPEFVQQVFDMFGDGSVSHAGKEG